MSIRKTFTQEACLCYATPSASVLDCQNEGLLCVSGEFNLGGGGAYGEGDINENGEY